MSPYYRNRHRDEQRAGDKAQRMLDIALDLACAVRDEDRDQLAERLSHVRERDKDALIIVLAALVPVDRPVSELLAWVEWDEHGRPLVVAS